jgi:hypothetical protein
MQHANRSEERISTALPVRFEDGSTGVTHNISASGIYFETDRAPKLDQPLAFSVEFQGGEGGLTLRCRGQVMRVEQLGARVGVAALLIESKLAPAMTRPRVAGLEISDGFAGSF